ncbi:MAG TPA: calcium-binding protein [Verrucomicrobiota bacterium]|nr:calcium-binding protein [Verrucomicrobiota bacterium]
MARRRIDKDREERIEMEIIEDAYDESERAMRWHCYLESVLKFPLKARCISKKASSPLRVGQEIEVLGLADSEDCHP